MLSNGMGGFSLAGLPTLLAWHGVRDVEGMLQRLEVIRMHRPPKD